jgi:hypothetical protein
MQSHVTGATITGDEPSPDAGLQKLQVIDGYLNRI